MSVDTVCLILNRADFDRLLGPLDELIKAESKRRAEESANANRRYDRLSQCLYISLSSVLHTGKLRVPC